MILETILIETILINFSKNNFILQWIKNEDNSVNLPDPESEKQHIKGGNLQCYQYNCCTNCWVTQNNPDTSGWTRNIQSELVALWFNEQQLPGELMKPANRKALVMQNPVCNKETTPPPTPQALRPQQFSAIVATYVLLNGIETEMIASQATNEMNLTPTLLIMTVIVVTEMMKCTPDYLKYDALDSLLDMTNYKYIMVNCRKKCIPTVL